MKTSLEVSVGQLFVVYLDPEGSLLDSIRDHREQYYGGVFLNREHIENPDRTRRLTYRLRRHTPEIPPPIISIDEEGGMVTNIAHITTTAPSAAALASADDPALTEDVYLGIGEKLHALGFNTVFAPDLDVNVEALNPVIGTRSFGADPEMVAKHGRAAVAGLKAAGMACCGKHFPGHGATSLDSHETLPTVDADRETLNERELEPFREILSLESPPEMVMTAHVSFPALDKPGVPATLSEPIIQGLLRRELGYLGVIITDSMEMQGITERYGPEKAAVQAIQSGVDILLYAMDPEMAKAAYRAVLDAVKSGKISESQLSESVDRVFRLRERFRSLPWTTDAEAKELLTVKHEQAFFEAAMKGLVLEGNAGVLNEIHRVPRRKLIVLPRQLDDYRFLPIEVVREQLEPAGFKVLTVGAKASEAEIREVEEFAGEASVVVVATASRGRMAKENKRLVARLTQRDVIKVGVALLDPTDAEHMMTTNCRIKTFGFTAAQLWAMCQKFLG